jgi:hypothetical protein
VALSSKRFANFSNITRKQVWRRAWLVLTLAAATISFGTQCALTVVSLTCDERVCCRRMAPALSVRHMVIVLLHVAVSVVRTQIHVLEVLGDFLDDTITKAEVEPFKQPPPPPPHTHTHHPMQPAPPTTTFAFSTPRPPSPTAAADSWVDSSCREACLQTRAKGFGTPGQLHPSRRSARGPTRLRRSDRGVRGKALFYGRRSSQN